MALRHDLDFADILAPVRRPKLQCASGRPICQAPHGPSSPCLGKSSSLWRIYAFAYGLLEKYLYAGTFGPHSALGTVAAALVVMVGVVLQGKNFDFGTIYRTALPLMAGALIIPSALGLFDSFWGNFCATGGYTAFSILIMLILANICYRYGRFGDMALRH